MSNTGAGRGFRPQTMCKKVSLVKGTAPLAVQTRQVENRPDFSMVSRAEVQRFGLAVPPPSVGRCNGGKDHGLGAGEDGRLRWLHTFGSIPCDTDEGLSCLIP